VGPRAHLVQLRQHAMLARRRGAEPRRVGVALAVLVEAVEAAVAFARLLGGLRIVFVEIVQHLVDRAEHAVQVQAVEAGLRARAGIMPALPLDEGDDVAVAPHPGGEAPEAAERLLRVAVGAAPAHVAVDAIGVGPVGFDGDGVEAVLFDQQLRDARAFGVELVRAVRGFAEQHEAALRGHGEQFVVVVVGADQRHQGGEDVVVQGGVAGCTGHDVGTQWNSGGCWGRAPAG
jgi:hypothetical protein